ncbi:asparagine synthase (glutamine-hydrolyzing) [Sediminibacterium goheungense]|uniref:asparagine synthase (glutamine-hydrolyzing) n=1 Tax=Sediminibacterium goheungense TaxID=1086393 RepID=A0A4R6IW59_9BACT|nr:asparagine synthase (glutamine-hydrolyzing) [Sediminibacterium goheungense]TDO26920.1 asparagine synthase (glutamine-hydrolysing) [Sediminibacterium goheungense]
MCAIAGYVLETNLKENQALIDILNHRGPDDNGVYIDKNVGFFHNRLAIVDLSSNGHQPMLSNDGRYVLVFNGEIYNHLDVQKELIALGYTFKSQSDSETLLYGFIHWGKDVLNKLNGIFAFSIYDKETRKIFLARDQFGVKPLYYFINDDVFCFSSELKAFRTIDHFKSTPDIHSFFYYLQALYAPGKLTPLHGVKKLLPGTFLEFSVNEFLLAEPETYYHLSFEPDITNQYTEEEWIDQLDEHLCNAVKRQMMSDVPIGFFLSGGLDSSLIVAIARKLYPDTQFPCFTISTGEDMAAEGFTDDESYARKVAAYLNVPLHIVTATSEIEDVFDKVIWHLDEPQADPACINVLKIAEEARKHGIKVLLGGTAGDDLFSGYRRHQAVLLEKYYDLIPRFLKSFIKRVILFFPSKKPLLRRLKKLVTDLNVTKEERFAGFFMWISDAEIKKLFTKKANDEIDFKNLPKQYWEKLLKGLPINTNDLNKLLFLEMKTFLPDHNLNYTDKMSMAVGVEARVPFLDLELVSFTQKMPVKYKMKGNVTKYLLRKVAERYLPYDVIYRPKTGFGAPLRSWISNNLKSRIDDFLDHGILFQEQILDRKAVKSLIERDQKGEIDAAYTIWGLLALESWYKQFIKKS